MRAGVLVSLLFAAATAQMCLETVGGPWNIRSSPCGLSIVGSLAIGEKTTHRPGDAPTTCTLNGVSYDFVPIAKGNGWVTSTAVRACSSACIVVKTAGVSVRNAPCGTVVSTLNSGAQKTVTSQTLQVADCSGKKYIWVSIAEGVIAAEFVQSCTPAENNNPPPSGGCNTNQKPSSLSAKGVAFIQKWEGLYNCWYKDPVGKGTICYGHLVVAGEPYAPGTCLSTAECQALFTKDAPKYTSCVRDNVKVPINQNQFDALTSFTYNFGCRALQDSTLLKLLNQGSYSDVCPQLKRWINGNGKPLQGLINRRNAECSLFNSCDGIQRSGSNRVCPEADSCSSCILNLGNDATFEFYDKLGMNTNCSQANWAALTNDWCTKVEPWQCYYATADFGNGTLCPACTPFPKPTDAVAPTPTDPCTENTGDLCADNDCATMLVGTVCSPSSGACVTANQQTNLQVKPCVPAAAESAASTLAGVAFAAVAALLMF